MNTTPQQLSKRQVWMMAARPRTLPAALGPVLVGTALATADGSFVLLPALAATGGALLLQIGVNLANDYFDHVKGVDTTDRLGPTRVASSGLISLTELRLGIVFVLLTAALLGVYLIAVGGWPVLVMGAASILAVLAYSGGPFPIASHGLGDVFVFIFFGLVAVTGTYYVQALTVHLWVLVAAVPVGALITAILVVNNLRDIDTDRSTRKRTLAVMIGKPASRVEYIILLVVAFATPILFWLGGRASIAALLPLLSLPLALSLVRAIYTVSGPAMNKLLAETARLSLIFSALFAIGLLL